ncbi:hypothetical protein OK016_08570 [Vibrio chagasii]|nr:hypothetical protein [Vibrio chagasii]
MIYRRVPTFALRNSLCDKSNQGGILEADTDDAGYMFLRQHACGGSSMLLYVFDTDAMGIFSTFHKSSLGLGAGKSNGTSLLSELQVSDLLLPLSSFTRTDLYHPL